MWPNHLLHVGQLFKASGNNYFAQIVHIFRQFLYFDFPVKSLLGNFYGQFGNFFGHLVTFMDIGQLLWTFGNFYGHLATFMDIRQLFTGHTAAAHLCTSRIMLIVRSCCFRSSEVWSVRAVQMSERRTMHLDPIPLRRSSRLFRRIWRGPKALHRG